MKKILILLFLAFSICSAQGNKKPQDIAIDSLKKAISDLAERQNEIKKSTDSIVLKASEKSHELYNTSFVNLQSSFDKFAIYVGAAITLFSLLFALLSLFNFRSVESSKKEVRKELKKIKDFETKISDMKIELNEIKNKKTELEKDFENKILDMETKLNDMDKFEKNLNEQIENQKFEFEKSLKEQIEAQGKEFQSLKDDMLKQIDKQEKDFGNMKAELEATNKNIKEQEKNFYNMKAKLNSQLESVYKEFVNSYLNLAVHYIYGDNKKREHFHMLAEYFNILINNCVKFDNYSWGEFESLRDFVGMYEESDLKFKTINGFLFALNAFRECCVKTDISKGLEEANSLWNMLCEKFGETNVLKAVKDFEEEVYKK